MKISPKVIAAVLVPLVAAAMLAVLTGDKSFLVAILLTLAGGGAGIAAKPAPNVTQLEVEHLSRRNRGFA